MKGILIFTGYNQRAVIAFLRTLTSLKIDNYFLVAVPDDSIKRTVYADKVVYTRENLDLDIYLFEKIKNLSEMENLLIIPSTEALNRFILKERAWLEKIGYEIPLVDRNLYESISDKQSFYNLCESIGLPVPGIIPLNTCYTSPFVAKPKKYYNAEGRQFNPIIVKNEIEYENFCRDYPVNDFDIQEYIEGESFYLLFYFGINGETYSFAQQNIAQQPGGKSIVAAITSEIYKEDIAIEYINLFHKCKFTGLVMVELRKKNDTYYMIEANPRLWGPSELFVKAGVNLFIPFLKDNGFISGFSLNKPNMAARYLWNDGIKETMAKGQQIVMYSKCNEAFYKDDEWLKWDIYNSDDTMEI